jgi:hypothetical protein
MRVRGCARMPARTTNVKRDRSGLTRTLASRRLAFIVTFALLLCHGIFGALHLFPADRGPAPEWAAAQEAPFVGAGSAHEDSAAPSAGEEYFAVLVVLLLGSFLGPLLRSTDPWCDHASPRTRSVLRTHLRVAHPARGPTKPLLQVFRL